ncbi:alpha/beta hydrolase family protein [Streptomyces sp. enrichment culture]|uniref:alpha/beta hydrolase family protein n=1 Tax=Streptomyces sp. enrichment culture TaxID=1795815 RepID=UPI003F57E046
MRPPDAVPSQRHVSGLFFTERGRFLLSWDEGPVLGSVQDDGALHIGVPVRAKRAPEDERRIELDGDAVLFVEARELFVTVHLNDTAVVVVESGLDGGSERWHATLPPARHGRWTLTDVVHARDQDGAHGLALTVEDDSGSVEFHQIGAGKPVRTHRPAVPGQLVHWDLRCDAAVLRADRGPRDSELRLERPLSKAAPQSVEARWADGREGRGLVIETPPGAESRLVVWDLVACTSVTVTTPAGHVDDARFLRDGSGRVLVVATVEGSDTLYLWHPDNGESTRLPLDGTGRLRIRTAGPSGIGIYRVSTLAGSCWIWLDRDGHLHRTRGDVPRYGGRATLAHVWYGRTPVLRYLPEQPPVAAVVALHGGPESLERDELRWDGLYRELLDAGVAVMGLNYCGSTGYGPRHTQRAWKAWTAAFREDVESCVAAAAEWGVGPAGIALLGGSFGGALALLGCVLRQDLAGAVASAPLIDIRRHAEQASAADPAYRDWFGARFELAGSATPAQRVFDPEHLSGTAPGQRVFLVHGSEDEVTQWEHSRRAADEAIRKGLPWTLVTEAGAGHVPVGLEEAGNRYRNIHSALRQVLGRGQS